LKDITGRILHLKKRKLRSLALMASFFVMAAFFETAAFLVLTVEANANLFLLKKSIITYNINHSKKSLADGSYRGEEGILGIVPDVGRSLGLNVPIEKDYLEAKALYRKANKFLREAINAISTRKTETTQGEHVKRAGEMALKYNKARYLARRLMVDARRKSTSKKDDRLNEKICSNLLEELLQESLKKSSYNLRDALGHFYNRCRDLDEGPWPLSSKNIRFVNYVFREFVEKAPEEARNGIDIDRGNVRGRPDFAWKHVLEKSSFRYAHFLEAVVERNKGTRYPVEPLLFMALMRQESNFNPREISRVGAVGLTQIMPKTARDLGMKNIFEPQYFYEAGKLMERERSLRRSAIALVKKINEENRSQNAKRARKLMQISLDCRNKRMKVYARYKRDLLKKDMDDRLDPRKAIEYGFKYFSSMMKMQKGDISLALASYNAGPHRVKKYGGLPPFTETVGFRNRVLKYYRGYLRKVEVSGGDGE
jgi:hypothetical protein